MTIGASSFDQYLLESLFSIRGLNSGIMVFYTGNNFPNYSSIMLRDPNPIKGQKIDEKFASVLQSTINSNTSIHDGAIMCGRLSSEKNYEVTGWSFRLHPPSFFESSVPNRGSAFNSGLAMSLVDTVDKVLFWSSEKGWCFVNGTINGVYNK